MGGLEGRGRVGGSSDMTGRGGRKSVIEVRMIAKNLKICHFVHLMYVVSSVVMFVL